MSRFTKFWGEFSFTKNDLRFFMGDLGFLFKKYLKSYFVADFISSFVALLIFSLIAVINRMFLTTNIVESEFYTILVSQFFAIIIFIFPLYLIFDNSVKVLNELFSKLGSGRHDFIFKYKLAFSVCLSFLRIFFVTVLLLGLVGAGFGIFYPQVFSNANLLPIVLYCLLGIVFWFCFNISCFHVVPEKFRLLFVQIVSLIFIISGGYIFPVSSFSESVSTLTQIIPTRPIADILLYNFLGSRVPGGAVVAFFEFFVVFVCLFVLVLGRCKNEKRVLFI